ncbi:mCG1037635, isoform CRA_a, partial [Mus musculus]
PWLYMWPLKSEVFSCCTWPSWKELSALLTVSTSDCGLVSSHSPEADLCSAHFSPHACLLPAQATLTFLTSDFL